MKTIPAKIIVALLGLLFSMQLSRAEISTMNLSGAWEVSDAASNDWFAATVPGSIHTDLLAAKRIPDPFFGTNESKVQWIGERDWTYRRSFDVSENFLKQEHVLLHCDGLDTLATIEINGEKIGATDNMFRTWEFNVKKLLKAGVNTIEVRFDSVLPVIREKESERALPTWNYPGSSYVRKTPCNFGWDWGPTLVTCGIWRDISLIAFNEARIDNVLIRQDHSHSGKVVLKVELTSAPPTDTPPLKARVQVIDPNGKAISNSDFNLAVGQGTAEVTIDKPQLWWPAGMGAHPLYTVKVALLNAQGKALDSTTKRIGLRTLHAIQKSETEPMHFVVNGIPFFAKGANWIPSDVFPNRVTKEQLRRFVEDAAAVNMNCLRFWGGGNYEQDELFDYCDELGICVWMDFKFGCATYPSFDPAFLENVRQEARDNVQRLRHHPSIALWCGNNEIQFFRGKDEWTKEKMSEADYYKLFRDTLGEVIRAHAPDADYVTGSPDCGDVHYWDVWHGGKPFEAYGDIHGFVSEFGFQAWPVPETINSFTTPADRQSVYSPVMKYHERSNRGYLHDREDGTIGTDKIMKGVRLYFREPKDFESTLWLSQITQAYGIECGAEGWRREMPVSMGCVYWQYNDTWPGTSWSSVDYFGRWKALHFRARHFYAPALISGVANVEKGEVAVWLTSDEMNSSKGTFSWRVTDLSGRELKSDSEKIKIPARKSVSLQTLELSDLLKEHGATNLMVWLKLETPGQPDSENLVLFAKPKDMNLLNPDLRVEAVGSGKNWNVFVSAQHPALWMWLDVPGAEARYSDNFIHLATGNPAKITVTLAEPMSKENFLEALKARSLFDTYRAN